MLIGFKFDTSEQLLTAEHLALMTSRSHSSVLCVTCYIPGSLGWSAHLLIILNWFFTDSICGLLQ